MALPWFSGHFRRWWRTTHTCPAGKKSSLTLTPFSLPFFSLLTGGAWGGKMADTGRPFLGRGKGAT